MLFISPDTFLLIVHPKGLFAEWYDGCGAQPKLLLITKEVNYQWVGRGNYDISDGWGLRKET